MKRVILLAMVSLASLLVAILIGGGISKFLLVLFGIYLSMYIMIILAAILFSIIASRSKGTR